MTGLHTGHAPIRANAGTIPILASDVTVAQVLKQAGYATGGFGKWGLGDARSTGIPTRHGFDRFFGYLHQVHAHSYYPDFLWDNDTQVSRFPATPAAHGALQRRHHRRALLRVSCKANRDKPFFLYACYTLPHAKFEIPSLAPYENQPWTEGQKTYAAMITRADRYIGRILAMLKQYNLDHDTVVFITSDNGAHSGEEKGFELFQQQRHAARAEGAAVRRRHPRAHDRALARQGESGGVSAFPWAFWDFMPTAAEIAGVKAARRHRRRLRRARLLRARASPSGSSSTGSSTVRQRTPASCGLAASRKPYARASGRACAADPSAPLELYDLSRDLGETKNVAAA